MTEEIRIPKFKANDFGIASFKRSDWHLTLTETHTMEHVSNPRLWGDLLGKIKRGDTVEAFKPDTGDFARFVVTEAGPGFIKLGRTEGFTPEVVVEPKDVGLETKWNVGKRAYDVIRSVDKFVMQGGFQTKETAVAWINDHQKKVAA
jgi:hypothetical protein